MNKKNIILYISIIVIYMFCNCGGTKNGGGNGSGNENELNKINDRYNERTKKELESRKQNDLERDQKRSKEKEGEKLKDKSKEEERKKEQEIKKEIEKLKNKLKEEKIEKEIERLENVIKQREKKEERERENEKEAAKKLTDTLNSISLEENAIKELNNKATSLATSLADTRKSAEGALSIALKVKTMYEEFSKNNNSSESDKRKIKERYEDLKKIAEIATKKVLEKTREPIYEEICKSLVSSKILPAEIFKLSNRLYDSGREVLKRFKEVLSFNKVETLSANQLIKLSSIKNYKTFKVFKENAEFLELLNPGTIENLSDFVILENKSSSSNLATLLKSRKSNLFDENQLEYLSTEVKNEDVFKKIINSKKLQDLELSSKEEDLFFVFESLQIP